MVTAFVYPLVSLAFASFPRLSTIAFSQKLVFPRLSRACCWLRFFPGVLLVTRLYLFIWFSTFPLDFPVVFHRLQIFYFVHVTIYVFIVFDCDKYPSRGFCTSQKSYVSLHLWLVPSATSTLMSGIILFQFTFSEIKLKHPFQWMLSLCCFFSFKNFSFNLPPVIFRIINSNGYHTMSSMTCLGLSKCKCEISLEITH